MIFECLTGIRELKFGNFFRGKFLRKIHQEYFCRYVGGVNDVSQRVLKDLIYRWNYHPKLFSYPSIFLKLKRNSVSANS